MAEKEEEERHKGLLTKKNVRYRRTDQVPRNSVRRDDVDGAADGAVAAVRREDDDRSDPGLERAMQVSEALRSQRRGND
jgi:hypothetical protein